MDTGFVCANNFGVMQLQTHGPFQMGDGGGGCKCFKMHSPTPKKGVGQFFCWTKYICTYKMQT